MAELLLTGPLLVDKKNKGKIKINCEKHLENIDPEKIRANMCW